MKNLSKILISAVSVVLFLMYGLVNLSFGDDDIIKDSDTKAYLERSDNTESYEMKDPNLLCWNCRPDNFCRNRMTCCNCECEDKSCYDEVRCCKCKEK